MGIHHGMKGIFLESGSGRHGASNERNPDYNEALQTIIERCQDAGLDTLNIWVASSRLIKWPLNKRKIRENNSEAIVIKGQSSEDIRKKICKIQSQIKETENSRGGNPTKRLFIQHGKTRLETVSILTGEALSNPSPTEIDKCKDISLSEDYRENVVRTIKARRGQSKFRRDLLNAYNCKCAITGCAVDSVLEAAHISPYLGKHTNLVGNGILLRADIHMLFDLGLLGFNCQYTVIVSKELEGSAYWQYNGKPISYLPDNRNHWPLKEAIEVRAMPNTP